MNTFKPNRKLYSILLTVSILVTLSALFIPTPCPWFAIITGIGCGGIASVIVAWLIEAANCKEKARREKDILGGMWAGLCFILTAFPLMFIKTTPDTNHDTEKHTWITWKDLLITALNKTPEEPVPESIKHTFEVSTDIFVREALYVLNQRAQLIADGLITERWVHSVLLAPSRNDHFGLN